MNVLNALHVLLGQHQQLQAHQAPTQQVGPTIGHPIQNAQDQANLSRQSAGRSLSVGGPGLNYNVPMQQDAGGYGQPIQGGGLTNDLMAPHPLQGQSVYNYAMQTHQMPPMAQGGRFNPGRNQLQDLRPVQYQNTPQHPYSLF